jgi:hypothetical protein
MDDLIFSTIKLVHKMGSLFSDPEFPASDSSLYKNALNHPNYADSDIEWLRPHEIH